MKDPYIVYAIPTRLCNLSCPHCDIKSVSDNYEEEVFLTALKKEREKADFIIAFGGEPTLFPDRLEKMIPYIDSISTNGLNIEPILPYLDRLFVSTSWNKTRFTDEEYKTWKKNMTLFTDRKPVLLITLTDDLIAEDPKAFASFCKKEFDSLFEDIKFEQLTNVTKNQLFYDEVDSWLCELYRHWSSDIPCSMFTNGGEWRMSCSATYTLEPNGILKYGCPQYVPTIGSPKCLSCELSSSCRPCILQKECTRPKKLLHMLTNKT